MKRDGEKMLNVPLTDDVRAALNAQASRNGRAAGREAARIITRNVKGGATLPSHSLVNMVSNS